MALHDSKLLFILAPVAASLLTGCHCIEFPERIGDQVDRVADHQLALDRFYRPGLDLTRICHDCKKQDAVCHRPVAYPDSRIPQQAPVEPTVPSVPPPVEQLEEPNLIPPVPPSVQPLDSTSKSEDWQPSKMSASAALGVGATPFMMPKTERKFKASKPVIELTTSKIPSNLSPATDLPPTPNEVKSAQRFQLPATGPKTMKQLTPAPAKAISAPAGVPPSPLFYQSLQVESSER